jgi:hypothetical protein
MISGRFVSLAWAGPNLSWGVGGWGRRLGPGSRGREPTNFIGAPTSMM